MTVLKKLGTTKAIGSLVVIGWVAILLIYIPSPVTASPCNLSVSMSGIVVRPPLGTPPLSYWSFSASGQHIKEVNGVVQGTLEGTFSATELGIEASPVVGAWSYNQQTGKLLIKIEGSTFHADIAILNLPTPGFTFSGTLFVNGQQPAMLVKTGTESISCS